MLLDEPESSASIIGTNENSWGSTTWDQESQGEGIILYPSRVKVLRLVVDKVDCNNKHNRIDEIAKRRPRAA